MMNEGHSTNELALGGGGRRRSPRHIASQSEAQKHRQAPIRLGHPMYAIGKINR